MNFQGPYDIPNWEFADTFIPKFLKKTKFISSVFLLTKIVGWDKHKIIMSYASYGEIK
jgi:hypothetical protein